MRKRSTLEDVARAAKVSPATVSRVMNRTARVSALAERRVRAAADRLGFDLRRNTRLLVAFLLANRSLLHPFHSHVLAAAEAYCAEQKYSTLYFPLYYPGNVHWRQLHLPRILERRESVDGFILAGVNHQNLLDLLTHIGVPFVVFGDTVQGEWRSEEYDCVDVDDTAGAFEATRHLQALGHTRIWYVANTRLAWFARRRRGYADAMERAGLEPLIGHLDSENEHEVGYLATKQILARGEDVHAIFGGSDATCHGVYAALREAGLRIPEDVSVAGFNDTPEATVLHPALTTVRLFPEQIGRALGELLLERIAHPALPRQHRILPNQVVRRESCQPLAARRTTLVAPEGQLTV